MRTPPHLWVVVTEPNDSGDVVVFMLTTRRERSDASCVLMVGDHPWIKHDTVPAYQIAEWQSVARLERLILQKMIVVQEPLAGPVLVRVQRGALECSRTVHRVKTAVRRTLNP